MIENLSFKLLSEEDIPKLVRLLHQMHPELQASEIRSLQKEMFSFATYKCFGLFESDELIAASSGWISVRFYSRKQLEVVNVIVDSKQQSQGFGKLFFESIEAWAKQNGCQSVELNTYVHNSRSHKFYFNLGYSIYGYHFVKPL